MKLEAKSFPIIMDKKTPTFARITPLPHDTVRSAGIHPVMTFTEEEINVSVPNEKTPFVLTRVGLSGNEEGIVAYNVAGLGILKIYDDAVTYQTKKTIYTARIPSMDKKDTICTGMVYYAIAGRVIGGG